MTKNMKIEVENIKCGGCERSIFNELGTIEGVSDVTIDRPNQTIHFSGPEHLRPIVTERLHSLGYPERGSVRGLDAGLANAKSFMCFAIGRVS